MPALKRIIACLVALVCIHAKGQLHADFDADVVEGCPPFIVTFSDSSTGPITGRKWTFGNGNQSLGNNKVVSATYNSPGYYSVKLVISDGYDSAVVEKQQFIHVFNPPNVDFQQSNPLSGCAPVGVNFTDNSTPGDAPLSSWLWDFGDASPLTSAQNPYHSYQLPGTFSVGLQVFDTNGCSSSFVKPQLVQTDPKPNALFQATGPVSACAPPLSVNFSNLSTGVPPLLYQWDYSIGTSSVLSPSANYTLPGGYDVSLIVTDANNCKDTLTEPNYIFIGTLVADFIVPDTICLGEEVKFEDNSSGGNVFSWDFGDGGTSSLQNPNHTYNTPGTYSVTLSISAGAGCDDTYTKTIYVEEVTANFTSSPNYGCEVPHTVNYTDQSIGNISNWSYHFGNPIGICPQCLPNTSNLQNPSNIFTSSGVYDDTLIVSSYRGCKDTIIKVQNVEIFLVDVKMSLNEKEACTPNTVDFLDISFPQDSVASVIWEFGDVNNTTSTLPNPQFTYVDTGAYPVVLHVVTFSGCTLSTSDTVKVGLPQIADFTIPTPFACALDSIDFVNLSTDTNLIDAYSWDFGDGATSTDFEPSHAFIDTGWLNISLIVAHNGCKDTLTIDSGIYINGPIVDFSSYLVSCQNPYEIGFISEMKGANRFYWNFGDSSAIDSVNANPLHTYDTTGVYLVSIESFNDSTNCYYYYERYIYVRDPKAVISTSDSLFCAPKEVTFFGVNSVDAVFFHWDFGGGVPVGTPINSLEKANYDTSGSYVVQLSVEDQYGCRDTTSTIVRGFMVHPDFSAAPMFGCVPLGVQFTDLTTSDTTIVSWAYDFGDGNTGNVQNPFHSYFLSGSHQYAVTLSATDELGCTDYITYDPLIETSQPDVNFVASDLFLCLGENTNFMSINNLSGYTYLWDFGDGTTSTLTNPVHAYSSPGSYDVSLTITNIHGCDSTFTRLGYIDVQDFPSPSIIATPQDTNCYPAAVTIIDTGYTANDFFWYWNFGDDTNFVTTGGNIAQHLYNSPGDFDIKLIVETTYGCKDSIMLSDFIQIGGPIAQLNISPDTACYAAEVKFKADDSEGIYEYVWDYGDGIIESTFFPEDSTAHKYFQTGWITTYLLAIDSLSECPKTFYDSVLVYRVTADLTLDTNESCVPGVFEFFGTHTGANQFILDFDDGGFDTSLTSIYTYQSSGNYFPKLIAFDSVTQCRDTVQTSLTVHPNPILNTSSDVVLCLGDSINLWVSGGTSYTWSPDQFIDSISIGQVLVKPDSSLYYYVVTSDQNNCEAADSIFVEVQQIPSIQSFPGDTTIFLGQSFQSDVQSTFDLNFSWTPVGNLNCSNCANPIFSPNNTETFILTYSDINGCFSYDSSFTITVDLEHVIYTPNTFTPNGDGLNDEFKIIAHGFKELKAFYVFNRWGTMVYEGNDFDEGWNGYYKGTLQGPNQIFVYRAILERYNGEEHEILGKVLLLSR